MDHRGRRREMERIDCLLVFGQERPCRRNEQFLRKDLGCGNSCFIDNFRSSFELKCYGFGFQNRRASEAYSEDAESDRQLEIGEDYLNDLDSSSDCPSILSSDLPKQPKGLGIADRSALAELRLLDLDVDDLVHIVETSATHFKIALNVFLKFLNCSRLEPSQYVCKYLSFLKPSLN